MEKNRSMSLKFKESKRLNGNPDTADQLGHFAFSASSVRRHDMTISQTQKKRILFVDDDKDAQELVKLTLTDYVIVVAYEFSEGLSLARQWHFDLYILDNWLPDGTGIELCRQIREFDPLTPILFYSAAGYTKDTEDAFGVGAQEYLIKPVTPEELTLAVARWVSDAGVGARSEPECE